jgi:hypothetical protein
MGQRAVYRLRPKAAMKHALGKLGMAIYLQIKYLISLLICQYFSLPCPPSFFSLGLPGGESDG